jgi:CheY-like chemotaxis protein
MLAKVFEMFVQVNPTIDRSVGGLGLGLTLVQKLVQMHGGSVEARSAGPGSGSEFIVRLPMNASAATTAESRPGNGRPQVPQHRRRVLVVEDSPDVREVLQEYLEELGHEVSIAANGIEGVSKVLELRPDVALVDVGLPGFDGYEVARRVRTDPAGANVFMVALTGYGGPEAEATAQRAGFDLHLTKPVDPARLSEILARS